MTQILTAAERYRSQTEGREVEIVDVTVPSGFVFKFEKPSIFTMAFREGRLPQTASNGAVASWIEQGLIKPGEIDEDKAKQIEEGIKLRDRVLELSREPKLVVGDALNDNELSTDDLDEDDAAYLFAWVKAGGNTSLMLNTFPQRPGPGADAGPNRKKRRSAAK